LVALTPTGLEPLLEFDADVTERLAVELAPGLKVSWESERVSVHPYAIDG
jgi:hypothetical protein